MSFRDFGNFLQCPICFDCLHTCMVTSCSHNFCSLCIRKYLSYKSQCPVCFEETSEPELRNNRLVDDIVKLYVGKIKDQLDSCTGPDLEIQNSTTLEDHSSTQQNILEESSDKAPCPVCNLMVRVSSINVHLDMCLNRDERVESLRRGSSVSKRKKLAKVVYHFLSDKELKKIVSEAGLNAEGDRQVLIKRHKSYLVLYNSECDSLNPRPIAEIVKQVLEEERVEEGFSKENVKGLDLDKKMDPELIELKQKAYMKEHQSQFSQLVEDIQQRHCNRNTKDIVVKPATKKCISMDTPCTSKCDTNHIEVDRNHSEINNKSEETNKIDEDESTKMERSTEETLSAIEKHIALSESESESESTTNNENVVHSTKNKLSRKIAKSSEPADGFTPVKRTRHPSEEF